MLNLERPRRLAEEHDIDALIASSPENIYYLTGFCSFTGVVGVYSGGFHAVFPMEGSKDPALIYPLYNMLDRLSTAHPWLMDRRPHGSYFFYEEDLQTVIGGETSKTSIDALTEYMRERDLTKGCIGIEMSYVPVDIYEDLKKALPDATFKDSSQIFLELRSVKSEDEVKKIRRSTEVTQRALQAVFDAAHEGVSEKELDTVYMESLAKEEGINWNTRTISVGVNAGKAAHIPTNYKLKKHDLLKFDGGVYYHGLSGAIYQGYCSDIARTAVLGEPTEKQNRIYSTLLEIEQKTIEKVKPGVKASDIYHFAVKEARRAGYPTYDRHYIGHGIGIELTERPMITKGNDQILEAGNVICIEIPLVIVGYGGFTVEDTIVVREEGPEYISTMDRDLIVLK